MKTRIKELRKANNLTLDELARLAGCGKSAVWELENRDGLNPSAKTLYGIAKALGTSVEHILTGCSKLVTPTDIIVCLKYALATGGTLEHAIHCAETVIEDSYNMANIDFARRIQEAKDQYMSQVQKSLEAYYDEEGRRR